MILTESMKINYHSAFILWKLYFKNVTDYLQQIEFDLKGDSRLSDHSHFLVIEI